MIELASGTFQIKNTTTISEDDIEELISNPHFDTVRLLPSHSSVESEFILFQDTIEQLNILFKKRNDVIFDFWVDRLELLKEIPSIQRVNMYVGGYDATQEQFDNSINNLSFLDNILEIILPDVKKRIDVTGLLKFNSKIESLRIVGNYKNIDKLISSTTTLKELHLASVKLNDLSCLAPITLESFSNFGPKILDYSFLGRMTDLKKLRITRDRKTESLEFISELENLEMIIIDELQKLKECPKFLQNKNLRTFSAIFCPAIQENEDYIKWCKENTSEVDDILYG